MRSVATAKRAKSAKEGMLNHAPAETGPSAFAFLAPFAVKAAWQH